MLSYAVVAEYYCPADSTPYLGFLSASLESDTNGLQAFIGEFIRLTLWVCLTSFLCPLREHAPYGHRLGQEHPHHSRWNTTEWLSLSQQNWEHSRQAAGWLSPSLQVGWPPGWPWTEDKGRPASGQCKVNHSCILTKVFSVLMYVSALYVVRRWRVMVRMERVRW